MFKNLFRRKHEPVTAPTPLSDAERAAQAQTLCEAGFNLHQQGDVSGAEGLYQEAIALNPAHFDALHLMGVALYQSGDHDRAITFIDRALEVNPNDASALNNRGLVLQALQKWQSSLESFDRAIRFNPEFAAALYNRALALMALERWSEALESLDRVVLIDPAFHGAEHSRANALRALSRNEEALVAYGKAIALEGSSADILVNRGALLVDLHRWDEALASFDAAIRVAPGHADAWANRGSALHGLHRWDEAVESYDRALFLRPEFPKARLYRIAALEYGMRFEEALAAYDRAIAQDPTDAEMHFYRAAIYLLQGDYARGWPAYEWRWRFNALKIAQRNFSAPAWTGEEALEGRTLLLFCEQGLGDAIQFCRYAPLLADRGVRVILEVPTPLMALLEGFPGVSAIVQRGTALPAYDYQCSLLSLPMAFRTDASSIPAQTAYLSAKTDRVDAWKLRLDGVQGPRVGLVASGNPQHKNDLHRSIAMGALHRNLPSEVQYISLQKEYRDEDRAYLATHSEVLEFSEELHDLADTAALIANLDLVISVDTSVAHLAAALGKPVWILLPSLPDWRWLLGREDSPWYPSVRLFRQDRLDDWDDVLRRVAHELRLRRTA